MTPKAQAAYEEAREKIAQCRAENETVLDLSYLGLTALPPELFQLTELTDLYIHSNRLTTLPPELGQLTELTVLNLSDNQLTALPPELGQLELTVLNLSGNQLTALPPELGQLELTVLNLSGNQLTALPPELGQLTALTGLFLDNNQLTALPLKVLQLTALTELYLHGNPGLDLPAEVLGPTWQDVVTESANPASPHWILGYYFAQVAGNRRPLNEVKVLVVGESEVGKTSLIRQLLGRAYNPLEDKTHGIERHQMKMRCGGLGEVRLNVWDFGGQDIMHATHQFFLTHRSVYVLVLDSRQNERQSRIDYWLRLIASYGGRSPVIVVCNKSDQQVMQLNWTGLQRDYPQIMSYAKEVCCYHHNGVDRRKGIAELKQQISAAVERDAEEVGREMLTSWLNLKDELERDERDFMTLPEYHALADKRGIKQQRDRELLLTLLHQLGSMLHFSEHAIFAQDRQTNNLSAQMEELNVLDPRWVTDGIYKLLNDAALIRAGGVMDRAAMRASLAALPQGRQRYPADKEDFLIAMMRRFEICFQFDGERDRWLLPDLLHKDEVDTGDWSTALALRYTYQVLPGSVMGRLMVRLHSKIAQHNLWRTGAKFHDGSCEALARSEPESARLDLKIRGGSAKQRREFLAVLRATLGDIHRSFSDHLGVEEWVPVPGQEEAYVEYATLLLLEGEGTAEHKVKVSGKLVTVNVAAALNGVTEREVRDEERAKLSSQRDFFTFGHDQMHRSLQLPKEAPEVWWKSWPAISAGSALGTGGLALLLLHWENTTARIVIGIIAAVFVVMMTQSPTLRFRRWFQWTLAGWMAANALGIAIAAQWKNEQGEAMLQWDGSVGWSFNAAFAVAIIVTGFLAYREWQQETKG
ncbi:MAG: leucine-rich repeat domain-containing protein [Verrucomicrobiaceae bacterium]|nr:leucine-rich repeat domain-containing protein [Verrucomicrobiaceae bacterium]